MRLFIAIGAQSISSDVQERLKKLKVNLKKKEIEHRWVPPENYHITINFLGEVEEQKLTELKSILTEVTGSFPPFELKLNGVGAYPASRSGRVIWMGVQNSITLRDLQRRCSDELTSQGWQVEDREYRPHLTLARLRSPRNVSDSISPVENQDFGKLLVSEVRIYESKLAGSFPVYTAIHSSTLRDSTVD